MIQKIRSFKIYNIYQANVFIKCGCRVLSVNIDYDNNRVYTKFLADTHFNEVFNKWKNKEI